NLVCIENSPVAVWHTNWHRDGLFEIFCKWGRFYRTMSPTNRTFAFHALFYMFCCEKSCIWLSIRKKNWSFHLSVDHSYPIIEAVAR
ncbi:MAG: hypothetical protein EBY29_12015, partial [Planctomycetes bacterium]|nr:hypothetical protein [Planctomycetota bacterium]